MEPNRRDELLDEALTKAFNPSQPRWPKGTPGGLGGKFMPVVGDVLEAYDNDGGKGSIRISNAKVHSSGRPEVAFSATGAIDPKRGDVVHAGNMALKITAADGKRNYAAVPRYRQRTSMREPRLTEQQRQQSGGLTLGYSSKSPATKVDAGSLKRGDRFEHKGKTYRYAGTNMGQGIFGIEIDPATGRKKSGNFVPIAPLSEKSGVKVRKLPSGAPKLTGEFTRREEGKLRPKPKKKPAPRRGGPLGSAFDIDDLKRR